MSEFTFLHLGASSKVGHIDEHSLWKDFKSGNKKSFEIIYKKYFFILYNYGFHLVKNEDLIKDSIHDLFLTIWKNREHIIEPQSIKAYLFTSFKRKLLDALKEKGRFSNDLTQFEFEIVPSHESVLIADQVYLEKNQKLKNAIEKLTKRQKEVVFLRYFENMEYAEIALIMSYEVNSLYVLLSKAIESLRKSLLTLFVILAIILQFS